MWIYMWWLVFVQRAGCLAWQKLYCWTLHANCSTNFLHTYHANRHLWLLLFCTTFNFTDLDLAWALQGQHEANLLTFLHTFLLIRIKFDVVIEQFKVNMIQRLLLSEIYWNKGSNCCFTDCVQKIFNVSIDSDVCKWIWFKLGMMIDSIVLHILQVVWLTLTSIQGHGSVRKQKLLC